MIAGKLKRYRKPGGHAGGGHGMPALIPMIDMLVILVVYMLIHTADYEILPNTKNISIPQSISEAKPRESLVMMVTKDTVFVNGVPAASVAEIDGSPELVVEPLRARLAEESQKRLLSTPDDDGAREVTVLADKSLPYRVLNKIMRTASAADIGKLSLAVIEKERAYSGPAVE
jgi:biopolymer transport protein ExbD